MIPILDSKRQYATIGNEIEKAVKREAECEIEKYRVWCRNAHSYDAVSTSADSIALDTLRRLSGPIASLALDEEGERAFRRAVLDCVRKAYVRERFRRN